MKPDLTQKHQVEQQQTMPNRAQSSSARPHYPPPVIPSPVAPPPIPQQAPPRPQAQSRPQAPAKKKTGGLNGWILGILALVVGSSLACLAVVAGMGLLYSGNAILPGVSAFGVDLGGKSASEATAALEQQWYDGVIVQDGEREWRVSAADLGIWLDAPATAAAAQDQGRAEGSFFQAILGHVDVAPVLNVDLIVTREGLEALAPQLETPPINAGVQLVNGQVQATPPQTGRQLDVEATLATLYQNASAVLADGIIELVMTDAYPTVTDSSSMVAQATQLLANPLTIQALDPVSNERFDWSLGPESWSQWLVAAPDASSPTGLALTLEPTGLGDYLAGRAASLPPDRYIEVNEGVQAVQEAVEANTTSAFLRVYHHERQHAIQAGETFSSIAYDYGIPYPWIQQANPGVGDALSVGQTITIPSPDVMLPLPIVYNKRIVVSISQQRMWAYENDQLKWEWVVSTGISSSPTAPGVFQIQSHETNAYAANWNLWMPYFMGVYRPVPTSDFMNGFHGFPTRGSSQLLWTNNLGTPVTYGCILVSNTNVEQLYPWAEDGVVVEIQR
ncbi:MAG: L,D-transpeptidase family protein [Anaerolineales bacterium]|nr:L,D-transpeptidase family protein [Anaerolineales bacterium]